MLIPGYPEYSITPDGRVFSHLKPGGKGKGKVLDYSYSREFKPQITPKGYLQVQLMSNSPRRKSVLVHILVAETYIPNPHGYDTVDHIDEDKTNNHISNLRWLPNRENIRRSKCKEWEVTCPDGTVITVTDLVAFCVENKLEHSLMCRAARKGYHHKGYRVKKSAASALPLL